MEFYILTKDVDKVTLLQTNLGNITNPTKKNKKEKASVKVEGPESKMIELCDRT